MWGVDIRTRLKCIADYPLPRRHRSTAPARPITRLYFTSTGLPGRQPLVGHVEMDDAYLGGKDQGGKRGRGAGHKTPFVAAVQCNDDGHPIRMKMMCVKGFRKEEILRLGPVMLAAGSEVVTDGLSCFQCLGECGCAHVPVKAGGNKEVQNSTFKWVNTVLGNVKKSITGTYQAIQKHYHRYLASFAYRFNRRFDLGSMLARLAWVALRTPPMPSRLLKCSL